MIRGQTEMLVRTASLAASVLLTTRWFAAQAPNDMPMALIVLAAAAVLGANNML